MSYRKTGRLEKEKVIKGKKVLRGDMLLLFLGEVRNLKEDWGIGRSKKVSPMQKMRALRNGEVRPLEGEEPSKD